jgi:hypothetical protein
VPVPTGVTITMGLGRSSTRALECAIPMSYDHRTVEPKWQACWREARLHRTTDDPQRPRFYALDMFPYPSWHALLSEAGRGEEQI